MAIALSIVVVDDRPLVIEGLQRILQDSDFDIAAQTGQPDAVGDLLRSARPNVLVMESRLGIHDNLSAITTARQIISDLPILVFSKHTDSIVVARSIALGATNFVSKLENGRELIAAIRATAQNQKPHEHSLFGRTKAIMDRRDNSDDPGYSLTRREMQVLRNLGLGLSNREIAQALGISLETVKEHVQNVLRKTNAVDRTQAAVLAVKLRLV